MLDAVAELAQNHLGHVGGVLGDEIDPDPLGADQPRHLFNLGNQRLGRVVEQKMRLVEEKDQLWLFGIAHLGQFLKKLGQQPQKEGRIKPGSGIHQLVGSQQVDHAAPLRVHAHQVGQFQRGLAEHLRGTLIFQNQKAALDRPDRSGRDQPIARRNLAVVFGDEGQKRLQVLQIQKRQFFFIGQTEGDVQHALLRFGQLQKTAQEQGSHLGYSGADRVALFAEQIPEGDRKRLILQIKPDGGRPLHERLMQLVLRRSGLRDAGQIAFDIGHEHRHPGGRKPFGQDLQRHRLAGAGRPGDQPVPIAVFEQEVLRHAITFTTPTHKNRVRHARPHLQ